MASIKTYTAPDATLVELLLAHNNIKAEKNRVLERGEKEFQYEEFQIANVTADWVDHELEIERKRLRARPQELVTFINMNVLNGRDVYDRNENNRMKLADQLRRWIADIMRRYNAIGKHEEQDNATIMLNKLDDAQTQNIMDVWREVLNWEGGLD